MMPAKGSWPPWSWRHDRTFPTVCVSRLQRITRPPGLPKVLPFSPSPLCCVGDSQPPRGGLHVALPDSSGGASGPHFHGWILSPYPAGLRKIGETCRHFYERLWCLPVAADGVVKRRALGLLA